MNSNEKQVIAMDCNFLVVNGSIELQKISIVDINGDAILDTFVRKTVPPFYGFEDQNDIEDNMENEDYMMFNDVLTFLSELFQNKIILLKHPNLIIHYLKISNENTLDVGNLLIVNANGDELPASEQLVYQIMFKSLIQLDDTLENAKLYMNLYNMCNPSASNG